MTTRPPQAFTDAQRMELRSYVELAGEAIAQFWPMRTFIHHNPLHGLETLSFEQAVARGTELFGACGYLSNDTYRRYFRQGRIREEDVRTALHPMAGDKRVTFGSLEVSHQDVLAASLIHGISDPTTSKPSHTPDGDPEAPSRIEAWLASALGNQVVGTPPALAPWPSSDLPRRETLGAWCDRTLGTSIVETLNRELVKWASAFLDEGEVSWSMPEREQTFYRAWKTLARHDLTLRLLGISEAPAKIQALPHRPEEALLQSLMQLGIPKSAWEEYLARHLSAMPGWSGYIKWRAHQSDHPWQEQFPIDLVKYLAVRLFYERELVDQACRSQLGLAGNTGDIAAYIDHHPHAYWFRREWIAGRLSSDAAAIGKNLAASDRRHDHAQWEEAGRRQYEAVLNEHQARAIRRGADRLLRLAQALSVPLESVVTTAPSDARTILQWLEDFPPSHHGAVWLEAFEGSHRHQLLSELQTAAQQPPSTPSLGEGNSGSRPLAQVVFCIDVRSEVFRRHLEDRGGYETLGLAGFFGVPLYYQPFNAHHTVTHCPVLLKPKNHVRELPRSYHGVLAERHKTAAQLAEAAHTLLHDLKENVVTPYVMVEALGWFFSLPFFGKTLLPRWYHAIGRWLREMLTPAMATTLTVDKLSREEAEEMVAAEQRGQIREILRARFGLSGPTLSPTLLESIRRNALGQADPTGSEVAALLSLTTENEQALYRDLREHQRISPRGVSERLDRITQTGFSVSEQTYFVEAALRLMGLTSNFSRMVIFCAHGSTSQNNPYESALDCGACGGNQGLPNARAIAAMANHPAVRAQLLARGITIPGDTHFLAAQHDTTTDRVRIVDLEDVPATHRKDLQRLLTDLDEAGTQASLERNRALGQVAAPSDSRRSRLLAQRRSEDWSEVRPEWGLSRNSAMIIGRRALTQPVDLRGRAFLHSYDHRQDASGKLLEAIMTAPLVVAQWINMEHYFSTVDNEVYGSSSKVYHNVVGRIGVMTGVWSDLRIGLPAQTVLNGGEPYHEPMRLLAIIEAPPARIRAIVDRHPLLEQLFRLRWVTLVALDPQDNRFYHYDPSGEWRGGDTNDARVHTASHEGN